MKKLIPLLLAFICSATTVLAQSPGQILRGTVTDADTGEPLNGAAAYLLKTNPPIGATTSESGSYLIEKLPVGRYQVQISHLGYETLTIAEVLVASGRETVLNIQLREREDSLQTVVVKASSLNNSSDAPINLLNFSVEEQFRFPATNFDPARLAMSYPGVAGENDGTNIISVRGNSPNALQWRLEGVEIVNPNHTANAGTFGDRPTGAGGGVNILSAQVLGSSSLLTGAFPAQYGNALGGIMDMNLRSGNDQRHELIAQAGFIGIEAAAEGPISVGSSAVGSGQSGATNAASPSFLVNYRYSFTGLLTAMGADFGDEATAYQDVAFHVALPGKRGGKLSVFGVGGKSSTLYRSPTDSAKIDKERFNIDFQSKMGAAGMTYVKPLGKHSVWRTVAILSALEHERTAYIATSGVRSESDHLRQQKLSISSNFSHKINANNRIKFGAEAALDDENYKTIVSTFGGNVVASGWFLQPFFDWHTNFGARCELGAGLHGSIYNLQYSEQLLEPRLSLAIGFGRGKLVFGYDQYSQRLPTQLNLFQNKRKQLGVTKARQLTAGYQLEFTNSVVFKAAAYLQNLYDVPVYFGKDGPVSSLNFTDFSLTYLSRGEPIFANNFGNGGKGRNYGLDLSLQKYLTDRAFFLLAGSLYRSKFYVPQLGLVREEWKSTRFDGGHTLNLTVGREFTKQKNGKTIINGISGKLAWLGGFRDTPIDLAASEATGYTVYFQQYAFTEKLDDYFRIDLRLYRKWNKTSKNSMLSLDIQNLTNRKNAQYHYFDTVQGKVLLKRQLGLLPIMTWRGEF
jgi:CarboxypepD_reg-like domain